MRLDIHVNYPGCCEEAFRIYGQTMLSVTILLLAGVVSCGRVESEARVDSGASASTATATAAAAGRTYPVTDTSIAGIRPGMTLDSVRRMYASAEFERSEDADGASFIGIMLGPEDRINAAVDEERPSDSIDYSRRITYLETFDSTFVAANGVRVGSLVKDVEGIFGPVKEIIESEIESRQFVTFERQPPTMVFRLDYTGIFPQGSRRTTRYEPEASIFSIAIVPR